MLAILLVASMAMLALATPQEYQVTRPSSLKPITIPLLQPPYVKTPGPVAKRTDMPTATCALAKSSPLVANTSTTTLDPVTVTITLEATTFCTALHNGTEVPIATFSSGQTPTTTMGGAMPGCTPVCVEPNENGECDVIAGCVGGSSTESQSFQQSEGKGTKMAGDFSETLFIVLGLIILGPVALNLW